MIYLKELIIVCLIHLVAIHHVRSNSNAILAVETESEGQEEPSSSSSSSSSSSEEKNIKEDQVREEEEELDLTDEWQEVRPGQAVRGPGHFRLNLAEGTRQAKLLRGRGTEKLNIGHKSAEDSRKASHLRKAAFAKAEKALKALVSASDSSKEEDVKKKFRSIEALTEEFEKLNLMVKSESEIMKELIEKFRKATTEEKKTILQDLEYYVHKHDIAIDFFNMAGFTMILPELNNSDPTVRALVCQTLGAATQNNIKVQIAAYENNVIDALLRVLASDPSVAVQKAAVFAISSEIRLFPLAQQHFAKGGGFAVLADLFKDAKSKGDPAALKLRAKIASVINTLLMEQEIRRKEPPGTDQHEEAMRQYDAVNLHDSLKSAGFCQIIPSFLHQGDSDVQQSSVESMLALAGHCRQEFQEHLPLLNEIISVAEEAADRHMDTELNDYLVKLKKLTGLLSASLPEERGFVKEEL